MKKDMDIVLECARRRILERENRLLARRLASAPTFEEQLRALRALGTGGVWEKANGKEAAERRAAPLSS